MAHQSARINGAAIRRGVPGERRVGDCQRPLVEQAAAVSADPVDDAEAGD